MPTFAATQDFDKAFLESLPENVASDLIDRASKEDTLQDPQYRRPSTFIKKPNLVSQRFGSKVFSMMQSSLMPLNEPNFDSSYSLDFGDDLELQLTGQQSYITKLNIKRDGSVNIKDIGKLYLAGLSLNEATNLIKTKVKESFIGVEAYVTLTNVRDVQIVMAGNVFNPGTYTLNGNSNIFHALSVAGGPSDGGSFRSIDLIRGGKKIESVDLYQTFIFALSNFNTRLRSGDMVFVNPVKNIVSIKGAVKRPGEYELINGEKLSSALLFANGLDRYADLDNIKLERILDGAIKQIPITNLSQFKNISPQDGDNIFIRGFPFRSISVAGAVINPNVYLMNEGSTLLDAIEKAGGYSQNAYPFGGVYENLETQKINQMAVDSLYADFLDNIINLSQTNIGNSNSTLSPTLEMISQLKNSGVSGRVIADFTNTDNSESIFIQDGDKIIIPEITNQVYLYGEISSEGAAYFSEGKDVIYYLDKKGGFTDSADTKSIYILHPNGETISVSLNKNIFKNQAKETPIYPGSIIFIPRKLDNSYTNLLRSQAIAAVLSNLGISLASMAVLKD